MRRDDAVKSAVQLLTLLSDSLPAGDALQGPLLETWALEVELWAEDVAANAHALVLQARALTSGK